MQDPFAQPVKAPVFVNKMIAIDELNSQWDANLQEVIIMQGADCGEVQHVYFFRVLQNIEG